MLFEVGPGFAQVCLHWKGQWGIWKCPSLGDSKNFGGQGVSLEGTGSALGLVRD